MLTSPTAAFGCSCIGSGLVDVVPFDEGERPPNTQVRLVYKQSLEGPRELYEDGVRRNDVSEEVEVHGETFLVTLSTEEPLTPGAFVEVFGAGQSEPVTTFTVGTEPDATPPTWDGAFTVNSSRPRLRLSTTSCGRSRGHGFEWIGLDDDVSPADELIVVGFPDLDGAASFVDVGLHAGIYEGDACSHGDSTLTSDFHRVYDVFVEDGAGNRIGPFQVDTRAGCGCASAGPEATGVWAGVLALAALGRRRRVR